MPTTHKAYRPFALAAGATLAAPALADITVLSQSRGVRGTSYARVGGDGVLNQDQITTDSGDLFNRDIIVAAFGQDFIAEASSGGVQDSRVQPLLLQGLIASNGVTVSRAFDAFAEARGECWYEVDFLLEQTHSVSIDVVIDNLLSQGDDWSAVSSFVLARGDETLFEVSSVGEFSFTDALGPGEYSVRADVVTTSRSADGADLALANLRQTFTAEFVVPAPASAGLLLIGLLPRRRR